MSIKMLSMCVGFMLFVALLWGVVKLANKLVEEPKLAITALISTGAYFAILILFKDASPAEAAIVVMIGMLILIGQEVLKNLPAKEELETDSEIKGEVK